MENMKENEYVNDISFIKKMEDEGKLLQNRASKERNNLTKNIIYQDSYYWELNTKYKEVKKNIEAYKTNMRTLQFQYEKVSAQYQEELRHRPELLNKMKATRNICEVMQEHLIKYKGVINSTREDYDNLAKHYSKNTDQLSTVMNKIVDENNKLKLELKLFNEKAEILNQSLNRSREFDHFVKQNSDATIAELKVKIENHEAKAIEMTQKCAMSLAMVQTLKMENEMKETKLINLEEERNRIQRQNIEMDLIVKQITKKLKDSEESNKLTHEANIKAEEKIRTLEKEVADLVKVRDNLEESAKLTSEKLFQTEEKLRSTEEKLQDAEDNIGKLMTENDTKTKEIDKLVKKIEEHEHELDIEINKKTTAIKELNERIETLIKENHEVSKKLRESEFSIQDLKTNVDCKQECVKAQDKVIQDMMATTKQSCEQLTKMEAKLSQKQEELANTQAKCTLMETLLKEKEEMLASANREKEALQKQVKDAARSQIIQSPVFQVPQRDSYFSPIQVIEQEKNERLLEFKKNERPLEFNESESDLDLDEIDRRIEARSRGERIGHLPLAGLTKRTKRMRNHPLAKRNRNDL